MASLGQDMDKLLPAGGSTMPALVVATLEQVLASLDVAKLEVFHFPRTNVIGIFP